MMKKIAAIFLLFSLTFCAAQNKNQDELLPSGAYKLDKTHASLIFRVDHLGFSNYTARFKNFDAELILDPSNPKDAKLEATVDPRSLETDFPKNNKIDFNKILQSKGWLDVDRFPKIKFVSREIRMTSENTANIIGDLTLHGVTRPMVLKAVFNGGYAHHKMDPSGARIGFSAKGVINRSEFGISYGIPALGTKMGVGDKVEIILEVEFSKPIPKPTPKPADKIVKRTKR